MLTVLARSAAIGAVLLIALYVQPDLLWAATPEPSGAADGGDPRSEGQGPGFVGDPGMAIMVVLAIGVAAALTTYAYVRLTRNPVQP